MKITQWFHNWQWLKCTGGEWNFARIVAFMLFIANGAYLYSTGAETINNIYSAAVLCSGFITGILIYMLEIFRENKKTEVEIAGKKYAFNIGAKDA